MRERERERERRFLCAGHGGETRNPEMINRRGRKGTRMTSAGSGGGERRGKTYILRNGRMVMYIDSQAGWQGQSWPPRRK